MPKVFITNYNPEYDYSAAEELGETVIMTSGHIPEYKLGAVHKIFENYAKTAVEGDYLLLSGSNIVTAIAATAWINYRNSAPTSFLQHSRIRDKDGNYRTAYIKYDAT